MLVIPLFVIEPRIGCALIGIIVLYFVVHIVWSFVAVEVHSADRAAETLWAKQHGKTPGLPDKLRGVFWMSTNAAPELLMTLEGQWYSAEKHMVNLDSGGTYAWTHSTGFVGWVYWFLLRVSYMFRSELHFYFNEDYTHADMPLYACGCCKDGSCCDGCWVPMGQSWSMDMREDGNTWDRNIYLWCMPWRRWELGSYVLRRIIDHEGNRLPAFEEMMEQVQSGEKVKGVQSKPVAQIMNGDDWKGHFLFGSGGNPDIADGEERPLFGKGGEP